MCKVNFFFKKKKKRKLLFLLSILYFIVGDAVILCWIILDPLVGAWGSGVIDFYCLMGVLVTECEG